MTHRKLPPVPYADPLTLLRCPWERAACRGRFLLAHYVRRNFAEARRHRLADWSGEEAAIMALTGNLDAPL